MAAALVLAAGCYLHHTPEGRDASATDAPPGFDAGGPDAPFDAGADAGTDGGPDAGRPCRRAAPVDLLLVIDDSGSMREEQLHLASQLPLLVEDLVAPPDENGDGRPDWRPIRDLHMGVVTTCADADARLVTTADPETPGCADSYPRFLSYSPGDDPEAVSRDFACVAQVGIGGCGIEQPLEMALRALTPSDSDLGFLDGPGQGDRFNDGFLRDDSLLAVIALTDEDDCSYSDPGFLEDEWDPRELPPCMRESDPLWPIDRYVEGFAALRTERPDLFAFAAIAGMPEGAVDDPDGLDYEALLDHPMMHYRIDPREGVGVVPACRGPRGQATPARRLVELARRFEGQSSVGSICQESFTPVVGQVARLVGVRACDEFEE